MLKKICLLLLQVSYLTLISDSAFSAVILQYHHVSENTPRSTSLTVEEFTAHLDWLQQNQFKIMALPELVSLVKNKRLDENEKIASISFDDNGKSICQNAWPILHQRKLPFTVFINTSLMPSISGEQSSTQCSWQELKAIHETGLLTVGNHTHNHPHMLDKQGFEFLWFNSSKKKNRQQIFAAQSIIDKHLGPQVKLFAYPYGEYNQQTQKLIDSLGYVGFGQQSGAIGNNSQLSALPRFPMSGIYANMETLPDKLLSLAFPLASLDHDKNPATKNPPTLKMTLSRQLTNPIQCFTGDGEKIHTLQTGKQISASASKTLTPGRQRYNCTAASQYPGRFYWYSYQWIIK